MVWGVGNRGLENEVIKFFGLEMKKERGTSWPLEGDGGVELGAAAPGRRRKYVYQKE